VSAEAKRKAKRRVVRNRNTPQKQRSTTHSTNTVPTAMSPPTTAATTLNVVMMPSIEPYTKLLMKSPPLRTHEPRK